MLAGDKEAEMVFRAFTYQIAKDVGAMAAILCQERLVTSTRSDRLQNALFRMEQGVCRLTIHNVLRFPGVVPVFLLPAAHHFQHVVHRGCDKEDKQHATVYPCFKEDIQDDNDRNEDL